MARHKRKTELQDAFDAIAGFRDLVSETFEKLTGKTIADWLIEFRQQSRELPPGEQTAGQQPAMPIADAYAVMGVKPGCPFDQVKKRYRVLSKLFHPDAPGGYEEAMKLLNNAYDRIKKEKR